MNGGGTIGYVLASSASGVRQTDIELDGSRVDVSLTGGMWGRAEGLSVRCLQAFTFGEILSSLDSALSPKNVHARIFPSRSFRGGFFCTFAI